MKMENVTNVSVISGFWLFIILIVDGNQGVDLLDNVIQYVGTLHG